LSDDIKVFAGGTLIDGTGAPPLRNVVILVESQKISVVGERGGVDVPKGAKIIDVTGKTIIPGLIDSHLHLSGGRPGESRVEEMMVELTRKAIRASMDARSMLNMGYTAVRDCGSNLGIGLKRAINEGSVPGPRIVTSGMFVHNTFGHVGPKPIPMHIAEVLGHSYADGVDECIKAVRSRLREGADFIKIASGLYGESRRFPKCMPSYSFEEIKAISDEAHRSYTIVASHCQGKEGIITSVKAGVDTIEHGSELDEECAKLMKKHDIIFTPNFFIQTAVLEAPIIRDRYSDDVKRTLEKGYFDSVRFCREQGVRIASGSDFSGGDTLFGLPMGKNAAELQALVRAGLPPLDAIVSATKISAQALMLGDKIGTLEAGKLADLVVVNGDPLSDISMLQEEARIGMVVQGGEIVVNRL
jgi:imidazolonepropionase-like amidohydrolase